MKLSMGFLIALTLGAELAAAEPCREPRPECREQVAVDAAGGIPVYRTHPLREAAQPALTRALIVIHGTLRNADEYFRTGIRAAQAAGRLEDTLVVAPWFPAGQDDAGPGALLWDASGWKQGDASVDGAERSSFEAMDRILSAVTDPQRFPALREVTVAGHSAGGQFVQRYAAGGERARAGVRVRYVVSNPSSYLYLNAYRADGDSFSIPSAPCDYDRYRYGLKGLNPYMAQRGAEELRARYLGRDVVYLIGAEDTDPAASDLDKSCPGRLQGAHRRERGELYLAWLDRFFPGHGDSLLLVPGVGHQGRDMFVSPQGLAALFKLPH
jgi:pimeloyl-ACP methyl ester carboxylesterase